MLRLLLLRPAAVALFAPMTALADEVVVYSARNEHLIKPLFDRYTDETGVSISYITDKDGPLLQRLKAEGKRTPADMLITVDAGNLWHAAENDVLAEINSPVLEANVPAESARSTGALVRPVASARAPSSTVPSASRRTS